MRLILLVILLSGCGSPQITKFDAFERSYLYSVKCTSLVKHDRKPKIYIVGKGIKKYCGDTVACYKPFNEVIYTQHDDWRAINHELLHHYCANPTHISFIPRFKPIEQQAKAR
jgi:hypothetical protein